MGGEEFVDLFVGRERFVGNGKGGGRVGITNSIGEWLSRKMGIDEAGVEAISGTDGADGSYRKGRDLNELIVVKAGGALLSLFDDKNGVGGGLNPLGGIG